MAGPAKPKASGSRVSKGRGKFPRLHFYYPEMLEDPGRQKPQATSGPKRGEVLHWPKEIPKGMTFTQRVNPMDPVIGPKSVKEKRFESTGSLEMFEYNFQLRPSPAEDTDTKPEKNEEDSSPTQSTLSEDTSDPPSTPRDEHFDPSFPLPGIVLDSGNMGSWPNDPYSGAMFPAFHNLMQYPCPQLHPNHQLDPLPPHLYEQRGEVSAHVSLSEHPNLLYPFPFSDSRHDDGTSSTIHGDSMQSSAASSRAMTASPFDSQGLGVSSLSSEDLRGQDIHDLRLRQQLEKDASSSPNCGHKAHDGPQDPNAHDQYLHGEHQDEAHQTCVSYQANDPYKSRECRQAEHQESLAHYVNPPPALPTLPPLPSIFPAGWHGFNNEERQYSIPGDNDHQVDRMAMPAVSTACSGPPVNVLQPLQTSYFAPLLPDRPFPSMHFPGPSVHVLGDRVLRPPVWNAPPPITQHFEPRYDALAYPHPIMPAASHLPLPPLVHGPGYPHSLNVGSYNFMPGIPPIPFQPESPRSDCWKDHFDFLQDEIQHRKRLQKIQDKFNRAHKIIKNKTVQRAASFHPCPLCNRSFSRRNSLAIHMKWHYKEREEEQSPVGLGINITNPEDETNENVTPRTDGAATSSGSVLPPLDPDHAQPRAGVLSISSLLSATQPGVASPITPFATPPSTPPVRALESPNGSEETHSRLQTGVSDRSTTWSLFGSPD
ncbi:hypothetical protein BC835DRAFT_1303731 [Cytidiella melzeri]|nr:hypothetical protein BC835DRAFT_1303731 [Cytidiella melzeri]